MCPLFRGKLRGYGEPPIPIEDYINAADAALADASSAATGETVDCVVAGDVVAVDLKIRRSLLLGGSITVARSATIKNLGSISLADTLVLRCGTRPASLGGFGFAPQVNVGDRIVIPILPDSRMSRPALSLTHRLNSTSTATIFKGTWCAAEAETVAIWSIAERETE